MVARSFIEQKVNIPLCMVCGHHHGLSLLCPRTRMDADIAKRVVDRFISVHTDKINLAMSQLISVHTDKINLAMSQLISVHTDKINLAMSQLISVHTDKINLVMDQLMSAHTGGISFAMLSINKAPSGIGEAARPSILSRTHRSTMPGLGLAAVIQVERPPVGSGAVYIVGKMYNITNINIVSGNQVNNNPFVNDVSALERRLLALELDRKSINELLESARSGSSTDISRKLKGVCTRILDNWSTPKGAKMVHDVADVVTSFIGG